LIAPATSYISTLSLHDALPIFHGCVNCSGNDGFCNILPDAFGEIADNAIYNLIFIIPVFLVKHVGYGADKEQTFATLRRTIIIRSEEHTSELQSRENLVCRLLL